MPHVLLVDDDPETLEWMSEFAKAEGFTVAKAGSLRAARIQLAQKKPDVMIADLQLPDGEGIELSKDLEELEGVEFVIATGGRIYLTKDRFTRAEHFRAMEPRLPRFLEAREKWDPERRLRSAQSVLLLGDRA